MPHPNVLATQEALLAVLNDMQQQVKTGRSIRSFSTKENKNLLRAIEQLTHHLSRKPVDKVTQSV